MYNFEELRGGLLARGVSFRTRSDTEVVVNLYEEFGLDFVGRLRGMFAFAIFDRKNDRLFLARDRIGKKPLYYAVLPGNAGLVFASEIKSLLEYPGIERAVDAEALDLFLTLEYVPAPFSIFKGIRKLPRRPHPGAGKREGSRFPGTGTWNGGTRKRPSPNCGKNSSDCLRNRSGSG